MTLSKEHRANIEAAIKETEYKYFGMYEFTEAQHDAVDLLVSVAQAVLDDDAPSASIADTAKPFQERVQPWMLECFGAEIAADRIERNHRFFEEATELVQANGMTRSEAHQLVDYTFDRPVGELHQEIGGVMVTLAALCLASDANMHDAGEIELARIWTKIEKIRAKQAAKPKHSPLPQEVIAGTAGANCATCGAVGTVTSTKARCTQCGMFAAPPAPSSDTAGAIPEGRIIDAIKKACGEYRTNDSYSFEDVWNCIEAFIAAPPAPSVADAAGAIDSQLFQRLLHARSELGRTIADPMWADHAEVSKTALKRWHSTIDTLIAKESGND